MLRGVYIGIGQTDGAIGCISIAFDRVALLAGCQRSDHHFVSGQRSCLVAADHRDRAQRFDRGKPAHDRISPRHRLYANSQRNRKNSGQPFRYRRDRQAYDDHEQVTERQMSDEEAVNKQDHGNQQHQHRQPTGEHVHLADQRRRECLHMTEQAADPADLGIGTCGHDDPAPGPPRNKSPAEPHAGAVSDRGLQGHLVDALLNRHRFAGEDRFLD